jgi:hypothetical protein
VHTTHASAHIASAAAELKLSVALATPVLHVTRDVKVRLEQSLVALRASKTPHAILLPQGSHKISLKHNLLAVVCSADLTGAKVHAKRRPLAVARVHRQGPLEVAVDRRPQPPSDLDPLKVFAQQRDFHVVVDSLPQLLTFVVDQLVVRRVCVCVCVCV